MSISRRVGVARPPECLAISAPVVRISISAARPVRGRGASSWAAAIAR